MKKDIEFNKVTNVAIGITREFHDGEEMYSAYLINLKEISLKNVMIRSKGIGHINEQEFKTATIRVLIENIQANSFIKIDSFDQGALALNNEYWISFYEDGYLYDKKYVFVPESIIDENFIDLPYIDKQGVMIQ